MADDLVQFSGGIMDKGVDVFGPQFRSDLVLGQETYNVTDGLSQGIGVRYGMSPLPGQSDKETPTGVRCNNLASSEGTSNPTRGFTRRTRFLRLIPVTLGEFDNLTSQAQFLAALVSKTVSGETDDYLDIVLLSDYETASGPVYFYERVKELQAGIHPSTWDGDTVDYLKTELLFVNDRTTDKLLDYFKYDSSKPYISSTVLSVSNRKIPMKWLFGKSLNTANSTTLPEVNLWFCDVVPGDPTEPLIYCGLPSQNRKNAATSERIVNVYGLAADYFLAYSYIASFDPVSDAVIKPGTGYDDTDDHYDLTQATIDSFDTGTADPIIAAVVNDSESYTEAGYTAILACGDKPVACLLQDWIYQDDKKLPLWVDLTEKVLFPRNVRDTGYLEDGFLKSTCFLAWPAFVRGTAMVSSSTGGAALVAGGILQADTSYEIAFSLYNKRINFETNVGEPVKVQIGSTGDRAISLSEKSTDLERTMFYQWVGGTAFSDSVLDFISLDGDVGGQPPSEFYKFINYLEYRFYYRVEGTFEWLPAGSFDAAELWFRPNPTKFAIICKGEVAALPGGQPGGFNDYSPLPKQDYRCVVNYKNRAWWISSTSIFFSLENNIFAYPTRNAITAQTGEFLGAIVHNYPGEAEQSSRLIIFASDSIYVARFTGDKAITAIRVSPNTVGEFALDGSDLVVDLWTTVSAFSQRSAVVAEGTLYYWGAQGIYRDDGTDTPVKISKRLEPAIFNLYDPTKTNEIFCTFNPTTKEIVWFYRPKEDTVYPTHSLTYCVSSDTFLFGRYSEYIDDIYSVDLKNTDHPGLSAQRTIINVREEEETLVQRPYFFDFKNQAGDTSPLKDMVIKTVATPVTGQRRLTLAAGYDATNFGTIVAGDYIALNQVPGYAPTSLATATDMIAQIAAVGVGTIDIILPDGAVLPNSTLAYTEYFPFWHKAREGNGLHAFPWQIETKYWIPGGINFFGIWQWIYMLFQFNEWPKNFLHTFNMAYRTPSGGPYISDVVRFVENSDAAMQLYHALRVGYLNNQGQALKMKLSGSHIGEPWVLQYLQAEASKETGNVLKMYQG